MEKLKALTVLLLQVLSLLVLAFAVMLAGALNGLGALGFFGGCFIGCLALMMITEDVPNAVFLVRCPCL